MPTRRDALIWLQPEQAPVGRPAERSRAEITAAAIELADDEGLENLSMRRLASALGTGAASLYRYVATRDDLLDLMTDATAAEYDLPPAAPAPADWSAGLLDLARQARGIMRRHPWLPALVITRPVLGPHSADVLEHVLRVLADHPAPAARKVEAFALLNALTALFVQNELAVDAADAGRRAAYLQHLAAAGSHPHIAALLAQAAPPSEYQDPFDHVLGRVLTGVLGDTPTAP